jgi:Ca2+:H+ antiporter
VPQSDLVEELSVLVAVVLLVIYAVFLVYTFTHRPGEISPADPEERTDPREPHTADPKSMKRSLLLLAGATVGAAISSEILVSATDAVVHQLGLSEFFVGVILVALVGNAAEEFIAIRSAWQNRLDATLAISAGASTQVALFVAPVLVFVSIPLGHPMDLVFTPLELVILGLATAIFAYINVDGESNWFEGVQLLGIYLIAAVAFFLFPSGGHP